jgi:hypothetical protein
MPRSWPAPKTRYPKWRVEASEMASENTFNVEIKPTLFSRKNGYDLTVWKNEHGWSTTDLTPGQLRQIRDMITQFLTADARGEEATS